MKKAPLLGILALLLVGIVASGALAFGFGNGEKRMGSNDELRSTLESGDYEAYVSAYEESDRPFMRQKMTEEQFNERIERFDDMQERQADMEEHRLEVQSAIETGDYDAWLSAIEDSPMEEQMTEIINEGNFDRFVEMHKARQKADAIAEELGLERDMGFGDKGMHKGGMHREMKGGMGGMHRMEGECPLLTE